MRFLMDAEGSQIILSNNVKALLCIVASVGTVPDIIYNAGSAAVIEMESTITHNTPRLTPQSPHVHSSIFPLVSP